MIEIAVQQQDRVASISRIDHPGVSGSGDEVPSLELITQRNISQVAYNMSVCAFQHPSYWPVSLQLGVDGIINPKMSPFLARLGFEPISRFERRDLRVVLKGGFSEARPVGGFLVNFHQPQQPWVCTTAFWTCIGIRTKGMGASEIGRDSNTPWIIYPTPMLIEPPPVFRSQHQRRRQTSSYSIFNISRCNNKRSCDCSGLDFRSNERYLLR
jgi:hypothetical protein